MKFTGKARGFANNLDCIKGNENPTASMRRWKKASKKVLHRQQRRQKIELD